MLAHPDEAVKAIAAGVKMQPAVASKYLRELNARGLLSAKRHAAKVFYRVEADQSFSQAAVLVKAITFELHDETIPVDLIYRKVTAFTHPRRVGIVGYLRHGPAGIPELRSQLAISIPALKRHLRKLSGRGFLRAKRRRGIYALSRPRSALAKALVQLAQAQGN
jgi:DNA-binding MarR family transcriptional regulator